MWLEVDQSTFQVKQEDLVQRSTPSDAELYVSPGAEKLTGIRDLADAEYCHAVEVDRRRHVVSFGRDYLGHYPMVYAQTPGKLFISDEIARARDWLNAQGRPLTLSEEAVGLYFAMGYVPQGMTLHNEIKTCRNASLYHWQAGRLTHENTFKPVAPDSGFRLVELGACVDAAVEKIIQKRRAVDVWCSGGLDSSIMAVSFNNRGRRAELLTLTYAEGLQADASEVRFAEEIAQHTKATLRCAQLTKENYRDTFREYSSKHLGPVVDYLVPLKYALAKATREIAVTGEGGDPLFSGAKNNFILYLRNRHPELSIGKIHALAHKRLYEYLPKLLKQGRALSDFVESYLAEIVEAYPGDLLRKLFYVNTFEKQGGMIFPKNYYAGKCYGVQVFHPLTSLDVYHAAFSLPDNRKYGYPDGKLALIELYKTKLPNAIIDRKKSGTRLPLDTYLNYLVDDRANLDVLKGSGLFVEDKIDRLLAEGPRRRADLVLLYGLLSLGAWITNNVGSNVLSRQPLDVPYVRD